MKFYEVLPALEEGKKIKRPDMEGHVIFDSRYLAQPNIRYVKDCISLPYHISESELLADDWEIIEDIPEVKVEYKPFFLCPKCGHDNSNFAYYKAGWTCKHCGQVVKLIEPKHNKKPLEDVLKDHDLFDFWKTETLKILNSDDVWVSWHNYTIEEAKRIVEQTIKDYEKNKVDYFVSFPETPFYKPIIKPPVAIH